MYNEQKIIAAIATTKDTIFEDLSKLEQGLVLSNLLLDLSREYLGEKLKKDSVDLVANGKRIAFSLVKNPEDVGLLIAYHSHMILQQIAKKEDMLDV